MWDGLMPLMRKTRIAGSSIVLTIPSQLAAAYNIQDGDMISIIPLKNGEMIIKKLE
jgi:antitoxin component of MazEF toxin-antitoxin module